MKCNICKRDHYGLCYQCPHNNQVNGLPLEKAPCRFCLQTDKGKERKNDSREAGHGRVLSYDTCEKFIRSQSAGDIEPEEANTQLKPLMEFLRRFAPLDPKVQFIIIQRAFFGESLESVAAKYRDLFKVAITPAGVSAAFLSVQARLLRSEN